MRLVYLHGAWVWTGLISFLAAATCGALGLLQRRSAWSSWSLAIGHVGLLIWLTSLPLTLLIMKINWGGFFFDEPRWRILFTFAVVGVLLQSGLALASKPLLSSTGNLLFGVALAASLGSLTNVLHPGSPILSSDSVGIQLSFAILVALSLGIAAQISFALHNLQKQNSANPA